MAYPKSGVLLDWFRIGRQLRISSHEADPPEGLRDGETPNEATEQLRKAWRFKALRSES